MLSFKHWLFEEGNEIKIHLPSATQQTTWDCGASALRSICFYYKVGPQKNNDFIKAVKAKKATGTSPENIIKAAKSFGLHAEKKENMSLKELKDFISKEKPVICSMQAWGKKKDYSKDKSGHYVIAIGFDNKNIYFEDPSIKGKRGFLSFDEFNKRWHDEESGGRKLRHLGLIIWANSSDTDSDHVLKKEKIK